MSASEIMKLTMEDLKKMDLEDLLVYINEIKDKNTVIIYLIKIIKQQIDIETDKVKTSLLLKYRHQFRTYLDLENKMDLIWRMIDMHYLPLDTLLFDKLHEMKKNLSRLQYTNLRHIKGLEKQHKKVDFEISQKNYMRQKEGIDLLFEDICKLYTDTMKKRDDKEKAQKRFNDFLKNLRNTPQLATNVNLGNFIENYVKEMATEGGFIENHENDELRIVNDAKAEKFLKDQEELKKKRNKGN